ncbi:MAG: hypothetical protein AAGC97_13745 [Planctomycetota bacterium]
MQESKRSLDQTMARPKRTVVVFATIIIIAMGSIPLMATEPVQQDSLLSQFTESGIKGVGPDPVGLPSPIDITAASTDIQREISAPHDWKRFTRDSTSAPIVIRLETIKDDDGARVGHRVQFRFVVHETFDVLKSKGFLQTLFEDSEEREESSFEDFDEDQVRSLGLSVQEGTDFGFAEFSLLKRIIVRGVFASQTTVEDPFAVTAWKLMDSIDGASEYRSSWAPLENDDVGRKIEGERMPYAGIAGYVSMASLGPMDDALVDACLVECHLVIHEPENWFRGGNLLRSKLPLIIQESVRKFRRKMK